MPAAKALLASTDVDQLNPLEWAWQWLKPPATTTIDVGGDNDIGYIRGCYLGEGDATLNATFRWCRDGAQLRFPGAASGFVQRIRMRVDGRAWPSDVPVSRPVEVWLDNQRLGTFSATDPRVRVHTFDLPVLPVGGDVVITLRGPAFMPDARDFRNQMGIQAGQARSLMVRIDFARVLAAATP
jgi:hypothetical protein